MKTKRLRKNSRFIEHFFSFLRFQIKCSLDFGTSSYILYLSPQGAMKSIYCYNQTENIGFSNSQTNFPPKAFMRNTLFYLQSQTKICFGSIQSYDYE